MDTAKNIQPNSFQPKQRSMLLKILKFILALFLQIFASKSKRLQPTLHEQAMGEKIPLSDQYYIPDDQNRR